MRCKTRTDTPERSAASKEKACQMPSRQEGVAAKALPSHDAPLDDFVGSPPSDRHGAAVQPLPAAVRTTVGAGAPQARGRAPQLSVASPGSAPAVQQLEEFLGSPTSEGYVVVDSPGAAAVEPMASGPPSQPDDTGSAAGGSASTCAAGSSASTAAGESTPGRRGDTAGVVVLQRSKHAPSVRRAPPRREVPQFGCAVTWQHRINSYTPWADFDAEVSSLVERGYGEGLQYVEFSFGMKSYKVCFDDMTQRATNSRRYVRRFLQVPGFLRLTRHPLVSEMRVATAACSIHSFPRLPEEVRARYEALEDRYYELLGGARTEIALFPVPAPRLAEVEEADVHSVVAAASMALWRLRPCPGVAGSPPPVFLCEASYREGFEELFRRVAGDAPPAAVEEGGGWMSDFIISAIGKVIPSCGARIDGHELRRMGNGKEERDTRRALAVSMISSVVSRPKVEKTLAHTRLARWNDDADRTAARFGHDFTIVEHRAGLAMDVALEALSTHGRVALVSAASAYQLGGGVLTGGRHALEEATCMQTTLYPSLARARELAAERGLVDDMGGSIHIPQDGCIVSPDVEVLREGTGSRYKEMPTPKTLAAVISLAMPNRNYKLAGCDHRTGPEYEALVTKKFHAAIRAAIELGIQTLVVPDCGCGVFMNDPAQVGALLGRVLGCFDGFLERVLIVGHARFFAAVEDALKTFGSIARVIQEFNVHDRALALISGPKGFSRKELNRQRNLAAIRATGSTASEERQRLEDACRRRNDLADMSHRLCYDDMQAALHAGGLLDRLQRPVWLLNVSLALGLVGMDLAAPSGLEKTTKHIQDTFGCAVNALCIHHRDAHEAWDGTAIMILDLEGLDKFDIETAGLLRLFGEELHQAFPAMLHCVLVFPSEHAELAAESFAQCFGHRRTEWGRTRMEILTPDTAELRLRGVFSSEEQARRFWPAA